MNILKTADHIRRMRQMKSYRSCPTSTGLPAWGAELGRISQAEVARGQRELRRLWLAAVWQHPGRACRGR